MAHLGAWNDLVCAMSEINNERADKEKTEVIDLLRLQIASEGQLVRMYEESARGIKSSPVMHLLHTMRLDSRKHIEVCQAVTETLEGQQFLAPEKRELVEGLERHLELEKEAIVRANKILDNSWIRETPTLRELVEKLRNDEIAHHKALLDLSERPFYREHG